MATARAMKWGHGFVLARNALICMWLIQIANMATGYFLNNFGLLPQSFPHLIGIVTAPMLHGSVQHLLGNSLPFFVLCILVAQTPNFWKVTAFILVFTGVAVWFAARPAMHVGASGLIMGYWGYLLLFGWLVRRWKPLLISLITLFAYGGMLATLLNFQPHVSWESHIFGFIAGLFAAWINARTVKSQSR